MKAYSIQQALKNRQEVTALVLFETALKTFPDGIFELPLLRSLEVTGNEVRLLPKRINQLSRLLHLDLRNNGLVNLPEEIGHLALLEKLLLDHNQLAELPDLGQLRNLKKLSLAGNRLEAYKLVLPAQLEHLDLSHNPFKKLTFLLRTLNGLRSFVLVNCRISSLPETIRNCTQLEMLDLSRNRLAKLPPGIGVLENLSILKLSRNRLKSLPDTWNGCHSLRKVYLNHNKLESLPLSLGRLPWLATLEVSKNKLSLLNDAFFGCRRLQHLDLSDNQLESLSPAVGKLERLYYLNVAKNQLRLIPELPLSLEHLDLAHNRLAAVPKSVSKLEKLRFLDLGHNPISDLPREMKNLQRLEVLRIRRLEFSHLPEVLLTLDALQKIEGLERTLVDYRLFFRFLKACKSRNLPYPLRKVFFEVCQGRPEALKTVDRKGLFQALSFPLPELVIAARKQLFSEEKDLNLPLNLKGLLIAGNSFFNSRQLKKRLQAIQVELHLTIRPQTTHILLGSRPVWQAELGREELVFISEKQLTDFLNRREGKQLALQPDKDTLEKLRRLLHNPESRNVRMAINLLNGGGVPTELLTDLLFCWKTTRDPFTKKAVRAILQVNLSEYGRAALSKKIGLPRNGKRDQLRLNIQRLTEDNEFDRKRLLQLVLEED